MEISIQGLKMYLLIHFLGRAQLEAVGKGLLVSIWMLAQAAGLGTVSSSGWTFAGGAVGLCRLQQGFLGPCSALLPPLPSQDMFYLNLLKHCLQKEVRSSRSGPKLCEARGRAVAGVQVGFVDGGFGVGFFCSPVRCFTS